MQTKLSKWCDATIEAGWLAALIVVPLFFNVYSARVFEPDKLSLMRSFALVMAGAWLVKWLETTLARSEDRSSRSAAPAADGGIWRRLRATPLVLPTLFLVLAYLVSTVFSLAPRISWWGSYQRLQGTYTTLSYIVIFFLVLGHLRRREQLDRLIHVVILTSLPISIYGIVQHFGLDPLPWGGDVTSRVASNMGNSIFVAAYLIMALFLTLERLLRSIRRITTDDTDGLADAVRAGSYLFVLLAQFLCIFYTQSRGPWLGLLGGLYVFVLLALITLSQRARRWRWLWIGWISLSVVAGGFLVVINLPGTPLSAFQRLPYVGRLGTVFELDDGTGRVRTLIWEGAVEMIVPHEPLIYPDEGPDRFNALRPLVGHGPEAMWMAYNRFYQPDLAHYEARNASPDRSHNETFDALVITGLLGFAAYVGLFTSLFSVSLKWLGAIRNRRHLWTFLGLWFGLGSLSVLGFRIADTTWRLSGVALPAGMILGFIVYVTIAAASGRGIGEGSMSRRLLIITLLATTVAHFIEIHFGIAIAATRTYFWTLSAVLVVVGMGWLPLEDVDESAAVAAAAPSSRRSGRRGRRRRKASRSAERARERSVQTQALANVLVYGLLAAMILFTLAFDFVHSDQKLPATQATAIFWNSLTTRIQGQTRILNLAILVLVICTWLVGMLLSLAGVHRKVRASRTSGSNSWLPLGAILYTASSLGTFLIFGLIQAGRLRPALSVPDHLANHITVYYTGAFALLVLTGTAIWWKGPLPMLRWSANGWASVLSGVVLAVGATVFIYQVNVGLVKADTYYKMGQNFDAARQWNTGIALHSKALEVAPDEDFYRLFRGRAELELAKEVEDPAQRDALLEASLADLMQARELNPLNTDHSANLGRLYRGWGQLTSDPQERRTKWERSLQYYEQAITLSPFSAHLYNEYGLVYQALGEYARAEEIYQESLSLDQEYSQTYQLLAELYRIQEQWGEAAQVYAQVVEMDPRSVQGYSGLGYVYAQQGKLAEAIEANLRVLELSAQDLASTRNLALLYQQSGELDRALEYAQRARDFSPETERPQLDALIRQIEAQIQ